MKLLLLLVFLLPVTSALACLNTKNGTSLNGAHAPGISDRPARRLESLAHQKGVYPLSEYALATATQGDRLEADALEKIFNGNYAEALVLLKKAEASTPGTYSLAANIGTTYELVGDNKLALEWIKKAIAINPQSHEGTEWVHVLVLEAKIRDEAAAGTGLKEPLIAVPDRLDAETLLKVGGGSRTALSVHRDVYYQLIERMQFVKPKDPYVADLLFSLAVLDANLSNVENANTVLKLSREYGYGSSARADAFDSALERSRLLYMARIGAQWLLGLGAFAWACRYALRKGWITLSSQASRSPAAR